MAGNKIVPNNMDLDDTPKEASEAKRGSRYTRSSEPIEGGGASKDTQKGMAGRGAGGTE